MQNLSRPTVTVIVPHYNRPDMVGRALQSILHQGVAPDEVILVDDHSLPENRDRLQQFSSIATILQLPHNLGISGARNHAAQQAKGEWLAFLDDDDEYVAGKLRRQLDYIEQHPEVQALGGGLTMMATDGHTEYWGGKPTRRLTLGDALRRTASMSQALLIRRETFLAVGGFDTGLRYMEDYELGIRLLSAGVEMHFLAEPMFLYHWGGSRDQLTRNWRRMFDAEMQVVRQHSAAAQRAFGRFGRLKLIAACYKKWGKNRGRITGRLMLLVGVLLEVALGRLPGEAA